MVQKQSHIVSTAACSVYDNDDDISNDSSAHAPETDLEDKLAEFQRYHDGCASHIQVCMYCLSKQRAVSTNAADIHQNKEKIFTQSLYDSDSNPSNPEEQVHERIFTESNIYPSLAYNSAEAMIAQVQLQYVTVQETTDWKLECTDYDNIESTAEVG